MNLTVPTPQAGSLAYFSFEDCSAVLYYTSIYKYASHFPSSHRLHSHSSPIISHALLTTVPEQP